MFCKKKVSDFFSISAVSWYLVYYVVHLTTLLQEGASFFLKNKVF